MPHPAPYELCCIGHLTLDRVITPETTVDMPGGTSLYFSCALSRMNLSYLLVTAQNDHSREAVATLRDKGIAVTDLPSEHSPVFENRYGHNPDHRTQQVMQLPTPLPLGPLQKLEAQVFHLGPLLAGDVPEAAIGVLATIGRVSLDVQGYLRKVAGGKVLPTDWAAKRTWLPFVHYLKVSEEELQVLTGCADITQGARMLNEWGVEEAIVTLGSKGSLISSDGALHRIPAFAPAQTVDTTGCGDTYMAGYLYQRVKGASIAEAGRFAAAMATLKIGAAGPFCGAEATVREVMESNVSVV